MNSSLSIGQFEVTYELWYAVYMWAINKAAVNSAILAPKQLYQFSDYKLLEGSLLGKGLEKKSVGLGVEVSMPSPTTEIPGTKPSQKDNEKYANYKYMPVHGISWIDAVVWCNAYSELLSEIKNGKDYLTQDVNCPYVYASGPDQGNVIKTAIFSANVQWDTVVARNPNSITAYRLPTEREWEYAARGAVPGTGSWIQTYAGSNNADDVAWWEGLLGDGVKHLVYELNSETQRPFKKAVTLGLKDIYHMSGNVWEWCLTDDSFAGQGKIESLKRGGSFNDNAATCETSKVNSRYVKNIDSNSDTGFRLVKTVNN
jgi:formylglycine-generating enzyme required for sulfatase activity